MINKAITFSYDDGVTQDIRLIELLDKYNLKATFNINSGFFGKDGYLTIDDKKIMHNKISKSDMNTIYKNHEVAVHTLTHPNLTTISDDEIIRQTECDRLTLSELCGYEVYGMAYPGGGVNNNEHVAEVVKNNTGVLYSRTITSTYSFTGNEDMFRYNPTGHHLRDMDKLLVLADEFFKLETDTPAVFYIWGHSYEFDIDNTWDEFESFCKLISGKSDIFYGTNREVFKKYGQI